MLEEGFESNGDSVEKIDYVEFLRTTRQNDNEILRKSEKSNRLLKSGSFFFCVFVCVM